MSLSGISGTSHLPTTHWAPTEKVSARYVGEVTRPQGSSGDSGPSRFRVIDQVRVTFYDKQGRETVPFYESREWIA